MLRGCYSFKVKMLVCRQISSNKVKEFNVEYGFKKYLIHLCVYKYKDDVDFIM